MKYGTFFPESSFGLPFRSNTSAMRWAASGFSVTMSAYFSVEGHPFLILISIFLLFLIISLGYKMTYPPLDFCLFKS
jgi:hypothetical protein